MPAVLTVSVERLSFEPSAQRWNVILHRVPDDVIIDCVVSVNDAVSHPNDPADVGVLFPEVWRDCVKTPKGLPNDFQLALDCGTQHCTSRLLCPCLAVVELTDGLAGVEGIVEVFRRVILHTRIPWMPPPSGANTDS